MHKSYKSYTSYTCNGRHSILPPKLPPDIQLLKCQCYNKTTNLPILPQTLDAFNFYNNKLTTMPALPPTLQKLYCSRNNELINLPELPQTLQILDCCYKKFASIATNITKSLV